ncbi:hypothetical protein I3843_05G143000 [Carya illinoinensis]|uniref:Uncharacterized protein n=1 Tax=Carya illinoinensis TaxID=32201 RepID=A0A8T1QJR3_CARIL|nr:uncharacterized protein LOC122309434 isoform X3 [Carya illinoinensis]KAG2707614.1 hypothetical protein I3760_05G155400 [Carya illinoinensis]KAG6654625.1 hypothetical protein CIPAW_05G158900 [Carya illinoinensis]KAG6713444.1 hypothetical protein I3842_05G153200 [Carya illinoinensis]KAG7979671.1 hypothetical protein I3843_05G143000 [Carya illinoinensis]
MLAVFISSFFRCPSSFSVSLNHTQTKLDLLCSCPDLMNPSRGLSRGDAFDGGENEVPLTDEETREARYRIGTGWHRLGVEAVNMEFWPVEHPMEPPDEDRPVKCPMPHSSPLNDGGTNDRRFSESLRKRSEVPDLLSTEGVDGADVRPHVQAVRKRQHTLTHGDQTPVMRMQPLPPTQNITVFQMLQQFDEFES